MNMHEAARILKIKQSVIAKQLGISKSTLYKRRVKLLGAGILEIDSRCINTVDLVTDKTLAEEAREVLASVGITDCVSA